ncbi:RNA-binding protein S1 [Candidatus Marinamargulisbacteria bacterium SCGC AG-439-L15]|nr:RNA-binding protein S1 [Candidatus Marinamargulisbacteria bacterium SCGC AG-439-L15]
MTDDDLKDNSETQQGAEETQTNTTQEIVAGDILSGSVSNVTAFGAFVVLDGGKDGLVHISEIANEFVKSISDFVQVGDKVRVKVLGINKQGKYELSMKQAEAQGEAPKKEPSLFIHKKTKDEEFEDKLNAYLKKSEEKQIDIRRNLKKKQGVTKKKK